MAPMRVGLAGMPMRQPGALVALALVHHAENPPGQRGQFLHIEGGAQTGKNPLLYRGIDTLLCGIDDKEVAHLLKL